LADAAALQRQDVTDDLVQSPFKNFRQTRAVFRVFEIGFERIHIGRQAALLPQIIPGVLEGGHDPLAAAAQALGKGADELFGLLFAVAVILGLQGEKFSLTQTGWPSLRQ
jgi:hypothetical protein